MTTCPSLTLNELVVDGATPDGDDIVYTLQQLDGWWDSAPVRSSSQEVQPVGEVLTANRENARAIVATILAHTATPDATALGDLCFKAIYNVKFQVRAVVVPVLLTVVDPVITLHALVRRVGAGVKWQMLGNSHSVLFQIQLLAEDSRRYDTDDVAHD